MKMQGYCNSSLWDTAFAVQAIAATGLAAEFSGCLRKAHAAISDAQVTHHNQQLFLPLLYCRNEAMKDDRIRAGISYYQAASQYFLSCPFPVPWEYSNGVFRHIVEGF